MRIVILTQPLFTNYGGLLQAYALQKVLTQLGHNVWVADIHYRKDFFFGIKGIIIRLVQKYILKKDIPSIINYKPNKNEIGIISKYTNKFITDNIKKTEVISSVNKISKLKKYKFDAYIVGSDQVWRSAYSPGLATFFLHFLKDNYKVKKIAYAASFGIDYWEYDKNQTSRFKDLIHKFNAVSVREKSAVELCKKYFDITAIQLLDPTLLLLKDEYINLINAEGLCTQNNSLMVYILDETPDKLAIIKTVSKKLNLNINSVSPKKPYNKENRTNIEECIYPSVNNWLKGFHDAKFVLTDSFHGTVFSLIFNKPFIVIGNQNRGISRFTSLLDIVNLKNRLILDNSQLNPQLLTEKIDYNLVNELLIQKQKESLLFLNNSLNN